MPEMQDQEMTMTTPQMVTCKLCHLLLGWSDDPGVEVVCIPCFDGVQIKSGNAEYQDQS
jgi:hypothetical protein